MCDLRGKFMAFVQRFSTIERGGIRFIGNTLGLSKSSNTLSAGTLGSIGAFTSLNNTQFSNFPNGTTSNYLENGSNATLQLPIGSTVLYAELIWGGLYRSQTQNISNLIDNAVTFTANGTNFSISPDGLTSQTFVIPSGSGYDLGFYVRTANVTNIVANSLNGTYSTGGVPALIIANDNQTNQTNHAGWTLAIVYHNDNEIIRNLTLWVGGAVVGPNTPVSDTTLTGFITPAVSVGGKVFMSAQEGDAVLTGDQFLFGRDTLSLSVISGPNNQATNFFGSQINNENGLIDTSGTFGTRNKNASAGTNISAGRQGWDITAVDVTNYLEPLQSSAVFRFTSSGDLYVPNALATQIDSQGASLTVVKSADTQAVFVGQNVEYTINVTNTGQLDAENATLQDSIPAGLTLVSGSIRVDGVVQPDTFPVSLGTILPGQTKQVTYTLQALSVPLINPAINTATVNFEFEPFPNFKIELQQTSNLVSVFILNEAINNIKTVDRGVALSGEILTYTSFITNNGNLNATDLVFTDTIPSGTTFVEDSLTVDGVTFSGQNPEDSVNIGSLDIGQVKTITFKVQITGDNMIITNQSGVTFLSVLPGGETVPGSQDSNIVTTEVISTTFSKVKSTADDFIREGENTTQSITLTNNSSFVLKNLFFNDILAAGASHVAGSVIIDGVSYPAYDLITGFNLPDLQQGDSTTISYTLLADNPKTQDTVDNFATVNYSVDTPQGTRNFTENTNTVTFAVISTRLDVVKSVDKTVAISGEILNYTSVITNTGSQTATNLVFSDILQAGLTFVTDSVRIDNVSFPGYNPISSFSLPNLNPGQSVRVDFQARVI